MQDSTIQPHFASQKPREISIAYIYESEYQNRTWFFDFF